MDLNNIKLTGPTAAEQYENFRFIDRGGFGEVYLANDTRNKINIVVKFVPINQPTDLDLLSRESSLAISLRHPRIVESYYFNQIALPEGTFAYISMEHVPRGSLHNELSKNPGPHSIAKSIAFLIDVLEGLVYAHDKIVHRDLKPKNLLIDGSENLKICDFGMSKLVAESTRTQTFKGGGSLPYMSPEAFEFTENTPLMDLYSVGIIGFQLVTGQLPFSGSSYIDFRKEHLFTPMPNIQSLRPEVPVKLAEIIKRLSEKRAEDRYQSAGEALTALNSIAPGSPSKFSDLASLAAQKRQNLDAERLQKAQEEETQLSRDKKILVKIRDLANQLNGIVDEINAQLEVERIQAQLSFADTTSIDKIRFELQYIDKSLKVVFFPPQGIPEHIEKLRKESIDNQIRRHGAVMMSPSNSVFLKDGIELVGAMYVEPSTSPPFGFNLFLRKTTQTDLYGEWWVAVFSDHALQAKSPLINHFAFTRSRDLLKEFELCRPGGMHIYTMDYKALNEEHFIELVRELLR